MKFFAQDTTDQRITGQVAAAIMPGWWIVVDDRGRKHRAASSASWRTGDRVAVVGGQIVDRAGKAASPEVFEV